MKKIIIALTLVLSMIPAVSLAQSKTNGFDVSLYANYWDVKDGDDNVWGPGLAFAIPLYDKALKLDLRAAWFADAGNDEFGDVELLPLDFGLSYHYMASNEFDIYPMLGGTYTFVDADSSSVGVVDIEDSLGGYAGLGGAYYFTPNWAFFTNVYYRFIEFDTDSNLNVLDDETLEGEGINVDMGVRFSF